MFTKTEKALPIRDRRLLENAREKGYLNVPVAGSRRLWSAHGLWCWRLKLPVVWFQRISPRSQYAVLRLDLFTTPYRLNARGRAAIEALEPPRCRGARTFASAHDVRWTRVPLKDVERLAERVLQAAMRPGNYELNKPKLVSIDVRRQETALTVVPLQVASA